MGMDRALIAACCCGHKASRSGCGTVCTSTLSAPPPLASWVLMVPKPSIRYLVSFGFYSLSKLISATFLDFSPSHINLWWKGTNHLYNNQSLLVALIPVFSSTHPPRHHPSPPSMVAGSSNTRLHT